MHFLVNLGLGLMFGLGLVISGMADPAKVLNFLDLFGSWDPSLAFVMGGAVVVGYFGYRLAFRRERPFGGECFHLPATARIDGRLVAGSMLFGVGWGLGGFCPGPALTAAGLAEPGTLVFVPAMLLGMWAARALGDRKQRAVPAALW